MTHGLCRAVRCDIGAAMGKAWTAFVVILMLLFGGVGMPALADTGASDHAIEVLDLDCHGLDTKSDSDKNAPAAPALHIDHHHCSAAIPQNGSVLAATPFVTDAALLSAAVSRLPSHKTAPPTQPPAA